MLPLFLCKQNTYASNFGNNNLHLCFYLSLSLSSAPLRLSLLLSLSLSSCLFWLLLITQFTISFSPTKTTEKNKQIQKLNNNMRLSLQLGLDKDEVLNKYLVNKFCLCVAKNLYIHTTISKFIVIRYDHVLSSSLCDPILCISRLFFCFCSVSFRIKFSATFPLLVRWYFCFVLFINFNIPFRFLRFFVPYPSPSTI